MCSFVNDAATHTTSTQLSGIWLTRLTRLPRCESTGSQDRQRAARDPRGPAACRARQPEPTAAQSAELGDAADEQLEEALGVDAKRHVTITRPVRAPAQVGVGAPARELGPGVDDHAAQPGPQQRGVDDVGQRDRVVNRRAVPPVAVAMKARVETEQVGDQAPGRARLRELRPRGRA